MTTTSSASPGCSSATRSSSCSATGTATPRSTGWSGAPRPGARRCARSSSGSARPRTRSSSSPPTSYVCLFAGAAGMPLRAFFAVNIAGTHLPAVAGPPVRRGVRGPDRRRGRLDRRPPGPAAGAQRRAGGAVDRRWRPEGRDRGVGSLAHLDDELEAEGSTRRRPAGPSRRHPSPRRPSPRRPRASVARVVVAHDGGRLLVGDPSTLRSQATIHEGTHRCRA